MNGLFGLACLRWSSLFIWSQARAGSDRPSTNAIVKGLCSGSKVAEVTVGTSLQHGGPRVPGVAVCLEATIIIPGRDQRDGKHSSERGATRLTYRSASMIFGFGEEGSHATPLHPRPGRCREHQGTSPTRLQLEYHLPRLACKPGGVDRGQRHVSCRRRSGRLLSASPFPNDTASAPYRRFYFDTPAWRRVSLSRMRCPVDCPRLKHGRPTNLALEGPRCSLKRLRPTWPAWAGPLLAGRDVHCGRAHPGIATGSLLKSFSSRRWSAPLLVG